MNELYMNKAMLNPAKNNGQTMGEYTLFRTPEEIELYRNGSDPWRYPNTDWYAATFKIGHHSVYIMHHWKAVQTNISIS